MRKALIVIGTRPEAIKLCPLILSLRESREFEVRVCVTAQHRDLLDQVLSVFGVKPDHDLNIMTPGQTLFQSTTRILTALEDVLEGERPDVVIVQGDTTTTFCGALASFYKHLPVGHVEAGLRTGDMEQPFPEEMNRVLTGRLSTLHFAPTEGAAENLYREGVRRESVFVTGNTGIDAVLHLSEALRSGHVTAPEWPAVDKGKRLLLVTAHRRESFGAGFEGICAALRRLAQRQDVQIIYPVHPNPHVRDAVNRHLNGAPNIVLMEPLGYVEFVDLMQRADILITDSGGIQEEGPSLGKPVLVLRDKTERPEAVEAGTVRLVGTDTGRITAEVTRLLEDVEAYDAMARRHNPYGDGRASGRIAAAIGSYLGRRG
jgi:UDP-N-acetylglucosamine 2-epimerase (non-hydrolysing)